MGETEHLSYAPCQNRKLEVNLTEPKNLQYNGFFTALLGMIHGWLVRVQAADTWTAD